MPTSDLTADLISGRVLTHDVGPELRKGRFLDGSEVDLIRAAGVAEVHVAELEEGDVHEDVAAERLAAAVAGSGLRASSPVQSQVRLLATRRGLFRAGQELVEALNALPAVAVFTLTDGQAVEGGEEVAGCKVTPVAVAESVVAAAEGIASEAARRFEVLPFRPLRTAVVVTERLRQRSRQLFIAAVIRKLGWYGADLQDVREVARSPAAVRAAYEQAAATGAELILFAGASSIDPLDAAYSELVAAGGEVLRQGIPAHPGSMLWLGRLGSATVLGVASCAGFGKNTALDLILPLVFANGSVRASDFGRMGYGGLIETSAGRRFPPYS